ncbi:hypothetical protein [Rhodococcoides fascians]|nr:hypothetical protein [Rhodococcus fascians]MDJ0408576.1 hypothetical protein [Rhodococcus fascians]
MSGPLEMVGDDHGLVCEDGVCEVPTIRDADSGENDFSLNTRA